MLIALSPDLVALVTDDIVDKDAFEQLLQIGFSTPAFEQVSLAKTSREWTLQLCSLKNTSLMSMQEYEYMVSISALVVTFNIYRMYCDVI